MTDRQRDTVYALPQAQVVDFAFNVAVADVFPDMIRRSVPGYETVISLLGILAQHHAQAGSRIYDLGCSLGAATLAMAAHVRVPGVHYICVDNAEAMVSRCGQILTRHLPDDPVEVIQADIRDVVVQDASIVVLNFTLQFLPPAARLELLARIHDGLSTGGVLVLSEKLRFDNPAEQDLLNELHLAFKRANGYSELEISQKRSALENVLIPDTATRHIAHLRSLGFNPVVEWFRSFNFASFLAIKP